MTENKEGLDECFCEILLDFMEYIPEPEDLFEYKRIDS